MSLTYFFQTEEDAQLVAQHLYDCEVEGTKVIFTKRIDRQAIECAIGLSGAKQVIEEGAFCLLRFPKHERQAIKGVPQIYVACLSAYNNGYIHGLWVDATQDEDAIEDDINWMLSWSPAQGTEACEEWAIHCFEGFGSIQISEYENLEKVSLYAQLLDGAEATEKVISLFIKWATEVGIEVSLEKFQEHYIGYWDSVSDFALSNHVSEMYGFEEMKKQSPFWSEFIDWERLGESLEDQDTYHYERIIGGIHVFRTGH